MSNKFVAETTAEAVVRLAVFAMELNECLGIGSRLAMHASVRPTTNNAVGFRLQLLKEVESLLTEFLHALVASVGKKERSYGVNDEQILRCR